MILLFKYIWNEISLDCAHINNSTNHDTLDLEYIQSQVHLYTQLSSLLIMAFTKSFSIALSVCEHVLSKYLRPIRSHLLYHEQRSLQ